MIARTAVVLPFCVMLAACSPQPGVNSTGTPTNAAEQAAGGLWATYIAADAAWDAYLSASKPDPRLVAKVAPLRRQASAALLAFSRASVNGTAAAERALAQTAVAALTQALLAGNIKIGG